jgi:hypothetical protein
VDGFFFHGPGRLKSKFKEWKLLARAVGIRKEAADSARIVGLLDKSAAAGDKVAGAFKGRPHAAEVVETEAAGTAGLDNAAGGFCADAGDTEQGFVVGAVYFHRKKIQMFQGPGGFGINVGIQKRLAFVKDFPGGKMVEAQQPVRLVQPVFAYQRRTGNIRQPGIGAASAGGNAGMDKRGLVHPPE